MSRALRFFFYALVFFLLFVCSVSAASLTSDVTLEGDHVSYDESGKIISAEGNVKVYYKNLVLSTQQLRYYTNEKKVEAREGFSFTRDQVFVSGQELDYNLLTDTGTGVKVSTIFEDDLFLYGKNVILYADHIELQDASFNGCGLAPPHYNITASQILLYPKVGWVVANWGMFWYNNIPLVPIPTYLYDARADKRNRRNEPPFPELGSDPDDGQFIRQRFVWHGNDKWYGRFSLAYLNKKGVEVGAEGNYVWDDANEGNVRLSFNSVNQFFGGVTHFYAFGEPVDPNKKLELDTLLPWFSDSRYLLETTLSYNERINYQRISYFPSLTLHARNAPVGIYKLQNNWSLGFARIAEQSTLLTSNRVRTYLEYNWVESLWGGATLTPIFWLDYYYFENNQNWLRNVARLNFNQNFALPNQDEGVDVGLYAQHYFNVWGNSPFTYDKYFTLPLDEVGASAFLNIGTTRFGVSPCWYLPDGSIKDLDYTAGATWHCYGINLTYRSMRREFNFSISLEDQD